MLVTHTIDDVVRAIAAQRYHYVDERELQLGIALALQTAGVEAAAEVILGPGERIDFLTDAGIGIEVKVARRTSLGDVTRQLARYASHERITGLVFVTDRRQLARLPSAIGRKPLRAVALLGGLL